LVLLEESDDPAMAGAVAVADIDLIGTELLAAFQFDDDIECRKLGYSGSKRYIRATVTPVRQRCWQHLPCGYVGSGVSE
jgi:hypothetical protein